LSICEHDRLRYWCKEWGTGQSVNMGSIFEVNGPPIFDDVCALYVGALHQNPLASALTWHTWLSWSLTAVGSDCTPQTTLSRGECPASMPAFSAQTLAQCLAIVCGPSRRRPAAAHLRCQHSVDQAVGPAHSSVNSRTQRAPPSTNAVQSEHGCGIGGIVHPLTHSCALG